MSQRDRQGAILRDTLIGATRNVFSKPDEFRYYAVRHAWALTKRFGARGVQNLDPRAIPAIQDGVVEAYIDDPNRAVLAALCKALPSKTFFEIGTNRGRTAWTVARNNPDCHVYTLDLPSRESLDEIKLDLNASDRDFFAEAWDRGDAYRGTPEESRITTLLGDSATFDFSPYRGQMDVVYIDGAHTHAYVENDTKKALEMLAPGGIIAWDDYPAIPGVYGYLNDVAPTMAHPLYHVFGTRLVFSTGADLVKPLDDHGRQFAA
jgi:Methyltransferase domain